MNELGQRIINTINAQGPISIAEFMAHCLYDPQGGVYASRIPIGAKGDYVTSPEVSQTFGEMAGLWIVQTWHNQGRPKNPILVELGPGMGTMARDVMRTVMAAAGRKGFQNAELVLVENSPVLRAQQQAALKDAPMKLRWVESFEEIVTDQPMYLYANEFFDCLPIHQYVRTERGWGEKIVTVKEGALALALTSVPDSALPADAAAAREGDVYETCPAAAAIVQAVSAVVARNGGAGLIFDYGYSAPVFHETLQSIKQHKYADVLSAPGSCDLSAHVDFSALAAAVAAGGAKPHGPKEQGDFLAELGIEVRARQLILANPNQAKDIVDGVRRLIDPKDMGGLFKVLAVTKNSDETDPPGFGAPESGA